MSIPCKSERSQLSHDEFETIRITHHPAIHDLADKELHALKLRLREQRHKARTLARQKQRETRGMWNDVERVFLELPSSH